MGAMQQMLAAVGSGGTPAWTPASLADLAFWANESSALTQSGGTASQWDDVRSNGLSLSQSTGADQPTVNATGLNSMRTLEFLGSGDHMQSNTLNALTNGAGFVAIVAVYQKRSSSSAIHTVFGFATNVAAVRCALQSSRTSNTDKPSLSVRRLDADSNTTLSAATSTGTSWCIAGGRMDYQNGDGFVDVNGTLADASNTSLTSTGTISATDSSLIRAGTGSANPATSPWADMNLAELVVLVGSAKPADSEFDKLYGYLAHKWGLASLLPALHPYKSSPP